MQKEARNEHTMAVKWDNYCNNLIFRITENGDNFPAKEEVEKLFKILNNISGLTPLERNNALQYAFSIRRRWINQSNKRLRQQEKNEEKHDMEEQLALQDETVASLRDVITKIAKENNIAAAGTVRIKMSADEGIVVFQDADIVKGGTI
jgi:chromosome condensin MukBEF ATPase and DNA-binding subunit MukB